MANNTHSQAPEIKYNGDKMREVKGWGKAIRTHELESAIMNGLGPKDMAMLKIRANTETGIPVRCSITNAKPVVPLLIRPDGSRNSLMANVRIILPTNTLANAVNFLRIFTECPPYRYIFIDFVLYRNILSQSRFSLLSLENFDRMYKI